MRRSPRVDFLRPYPQGAARFSHPALTSTPSSLLLQGTNQPRKRRGTPFDL